MMNRTYKKYNCLGIKIEYQIFVAMRLFTTFFLFFLLLLFPYGYLIAPFLALFFYYLFEICFLDIPLSKKKEKLEKDAPLFFSIFLLHLEENKNVKKALEVACLSCENKMATYLQPLLRSSDVGNSFSFQMERAIEKCPSQNIQSLLLCLKEEHRTGNNTFSLIKKELEDLEEKLIREKERKMKTIFYKEGIYTILISISMFFLYILFTLFN